MAVALAAFAIWSCLAVLTYRALFADGAHYFIEILRRGAFYSPDDPARTFACWLTQWPIVLLIRLGVTDLEVLRLAFGIGYFAPRPIALWICYRLSPQNFWLAAAGCGAGYMNLAWMAGPEAVTAETLFWPVLFALCFTRPLTPFAAAVLLGCSAFLIRSYESLLFLGLPLAGLCLWRRAQAREPEPVWGRVALGVSAAFFLLASAIALRSVLSPREPANFAAFQAGALRQLVSPPATVAFTGLWLAGFAAIGGRRAAVGSFGRPLEWLGLAIIFAAWGLRPLLLPSIFFPTQQYESRYLTVLIPAAAIPIALAAAWFPRVVPERRTLCMMAAGLLFLQSAWQTCATVQWQGFLGVMRGLLASHAGPVFLVGSTPPLGAQSLRFQSSFALPALSLAVHSAGDVQSLIVPGGGFRGQPFDPLDPRALPDLSRYGLRYDPYVKALAQRSTKSPVAR